MMSARKPCAIPDVDFIGKMNGTGRSVAKRLAVFNEQLAPLGKSHSAALELAIEWRNRRVHSLADDPVERAKIEVLRADARRFEEGYGGLNVIDFVAHFQAGDPPTFKEAASIIRLCHEAVAHFDRFLLSSMPIERYLKDAITLIIKQGGADVFRSNSKIWDHPKRERKALRILRLVGVNKTESVRGREVPAGFVDAFINLRSEQVTEFLRI
jgi:hypothetical protein